MIRNILIFLVLILFPYFSLKAENGYELWLRYKPVSDTTLLNQYRSVCSAYLITGKSQTISALKKELNDGLSGLLNKPVGSVTSLNHQGIIVIGTAKSSKLIGNLKLNTRLREVGKEGYLILSMIINNKKTTIITANEDIGLLYGTFEFLRQIQTQQNITNLAIVNYPKIENRILNHWDNLNGTIERGYAGNSIWNWDELPNRISQRYIDYARANASVGINGTVINNVNADSRVLSKDYLLKVKVLADAFRPYGIKVYLSAVFSAPVKIGALKTADPLNSNVIEWWKNKTNEIYSLIPDFGGFCVKANSEGQPGPQDYGRSHVEGANMIADALSPHGGILMWRAFVYENRLGEDRTKQAYNEFKPLDGKFKSNVLVQVKNGPIDFQPVEPFHPLFGAMPKTPLAVEFQLTKEYLGFSTHLVYLGTLFEGVLQSDTYSKGKGSTITKIVEGKLDGHSLTAIAGVANIGNDMNWTRHPFDQANWYVFGKLSWNPNLPAEEIADEWIRQTFISDKKFIVPVKQFMMESLATARNYLSPMGLTMLMDVSHYRPAPWRRDKPAPIFTRDSFHKADSIGIGYDRTENGSNAVSQYSSKVKEQLEDLDSCPDSLLLWFHHLDWSYQTKSGRNLWDELCIRYYRGPEAVKKMARTWDSLHGLIDQERFEMVKGLLLEQEKEAVIWRDACVLYFQTFSKRDIPDSLEKPLKSLSYYKQLKLK